MNNNKITVEDYEEVAPEFFDKYFYVAKQLGEGAKPEDIIKIMQNLAGLVMKKREEDKKVTLGFNKPVEEETNEDVG